MAFNDDRIQLSESEPLLTSSGPASLSGHHASAMNMNRLKSTYTRRREQCGRILESPLFHKILIGLITLDTVIVLVDLGYTLFSPECGAPGESETPEWLEVFSIVSLVLTSVFMVEIPFSIWAFGFEHYNPFGRVAHSGLHCFDAFVIIGTFVLEIILTGKEREFASLLVILRLWRLIKLAGGIAVGMGELDADTARELAETKQELDATKVALASARESNEVLRRQLQQFDPESGPD